MERHFEPINLNNYFACHTRFESWVDWLHENVSRVLENSHHASDFERARDQFITMRGFVPPSIERAYCIHTVVGKGWSAGFLCDSDFIGEMGFSVNDAATGVTLRLLVP